MGTARIHKGIATTQQERDMGDRNLALVLGELVAEPETRTLPSGSLAMSFSLTVRTPGAKTTSVPAVWYDPPKRAIRWIPGDRVVAHGSIVRRFFRSGARLGSSTELVVHHGELVRHRAKTARVCRQVQSLVANVEADAEAD